ncbi:MAG: type II toxin-antitoxin system VapC family toxin [Candidatus Cloacimonetes bacterium]|nr:type II toxin-antitoxin system VapC family toxin [Candidatus Cloacimonadota bacterium]
MKAYILDTFALMAYFLGEEAGKKVRDLLKKLHRQKKKAFLCEINLGEVYYALYRKAGQLRAEEAIGDISSLPITLIPADWELILKAAKIKATKPISFADAFVAALAKNKDAIIVTSDPEFKVLQDECEILWL